MPPHTLSITPATTPRQRDEAACLLSRQYRARGLTCTPWHASTLDEIILLAHRAGRPSGTLTVGLCAARLHAAHTYPEEIRRLQQAGEQLAELTRLAIDAPGHSLEVMTALVNRASMEIHARVELTAALIEVHPRHAPYYIRHFGFERMGAPRICRRANAPSVLLSLTLPAQCRLLAPPAIGPCHAPSRIAVYS